MTRAAGRALAAAILAALLASVLLAAFYLWHPALTIEFDADPPLVSGVYPVERDVSSGLTFAWTGQEMRLSLPGLDRRNCPSRPVKSVLAGRRRHILLEPSRPLSKDSQADADEAVDLNTVSHNEQGRDPATNCQAQDIERLT